MEATRYFFGDREAPTPTVPPSLGVAALIERDGALLMERRRDGIRWALIGGTMEADESLADALIREVHEETGLVVSGYRLFGTFSDPFRLIQYADATVMRVITVAYHVSVQPFEQLVCGDESQAVAFVAREDLPDLTIAETHRQIVECYLRGEAVVLA
jgi:ADP-ribose pyrophosphatase YjhB (NUDIX family)